MAHLWIKDAARWAIAPLDAIDTHLHRVDAASPAWVGRSTAGGSEAWLIFGDSDLRINGTPLPAGLHVLRDRDEIALPGSGPHYFSSERLATIEPFAGADHRVICPRCREPILAQQLTVRCPRPTCGIAHHQTDTRPCWLYADACAACEGPTGIHDTFEWTPEVAQ